MKTFIGEQNYKTPLMRVAEAYDSVRETADRNPAVWTLQFRQGIVELLWLAKMVIDDRCLCDDCEKKLQDMG